LEQKNIKNVRLPAGLQARRKKRREAPENKEKEPTLLADGCSFSRSTSLLSYRAGGYSIMGQRKKVPRKRATRTFSRDRAKGLNPLIADDKEKLPEDDL